MDNGVETHVTALRVHRQDLLCCSLNRMMKNTLVQGTYRRSAPARGSWDCAEFRTLFCYHFSCLLGEYEERALQELLYPHARRWRGWFGLRCPGFFAADLEFIAALGPAKSLQEIMAAAEEFGRVNKAAGLSWRTVLKARVSARRTVAMAEHLFKCAPVGRGEEEAFLAWIERVQRRLARS